jgi:hypothetical protein
MSVRRCKGMSIISNSSMSKFMRMSVIRVWVRVLVAI